MNFQLRVKTEKVGSELPIKGENAKSLKSTSNKILSFEKNIIISILVNKKRSDFKITPKNLSVSFYYLIR